MQLNSTQFKPYLWVLPKFAAMQPLSEKLRIECSSKIDLLDSTEKSERRTAVLTLTSYCLLERDENSKTVGFILNLLEFNAQYSHFEDLRMNCIDALYVLRQTDRLRHLIFPGGSFDTHLYRDRTVETIERDMGMKL